MTGFALRPRIVVLAVLLLLPILPARAAAQTPAGRSEAPAGRSETPAGTLTWGVHVTLAARWLDPSDTEAFITPFMVLYAIHDALVKPMPAGDNTPSLAESWTGAKDGLAYEFVLRRGAKFHNGGPVTAGEREFSVHRYRGAAPRVPQDRGREVAIRGPGGRRCH